MSLYIKKRKRLLRHVLVGSTLFLLGLGTFLILSFGIKRFTAFSWSPRPMFSILLMTLVTILAYKPLDKAVSSLFKNLLFKKKSYSHMTLMNLAEDLVTTLNLRELANLVVNSFGEILHLKTVVLVVPNEAGEDYEIVSAYGWRLSESKRVRLSKNASLVKLIHQSGPHVIVRGQVLRTLSWQAANRLAHDFDSIQSAWIIPLCLHEELVGFLGFATSKPETAFDESDFQFFREFSRSIAKSVKNARAFEELRGVNQELQDAQSRILQSTKLVAIEQLAAGLAHEIHNPLTIISGKAQVLLLQKDRHPMDTKVEEVLKTIVKQTKRAADITRKLLAFSQSSGAPKEKIRIEQVVDDTVSLISYQTSLDGVEITRNVRHQLPPIEANVHEIREVFLNLILNAVQSIGAQGGNIHIEMNERPQEQLIEILISDSGKGIPEENLNRLFNPFFTTQADAVGLGLYVTQQIVRRYGGSIRVESHPGQGSLFIIEFPYGTHNLVMKESHDAKTSYRR